MDVLLDATVVIDLLRHRPATLARLRGLHAAGDRVWTCAVVVDEVVRGLRPKEVEAARLLLFGLREAPLGTTAGWLAGEWRREGAKRGRILAQSDMLIAAAASGIGAMVATGNPKDFPTSKVEIDHWPVNE